MRLSFAKPPPNVLAKRSKAALSPRAAFYFDEASFAWARPRFLGEPLEGGFMGFAGCAGFSRKPYQPHRSESLLPIRIGPRSNRRERNENLAFADSKPLKTMARETGLEPAASAVTGRRSNQLSYSRGCRNQTMIRLGNEDLKGRPSQVKVVANPHASQAFLRCRCKK